MASFVRSDIVARIKERIDHPIIDADGHHREFMPLVRDMLCEAADPAVAARFERYVTRARVTSARVFWGFPVENVVDHVSPMLPDLLSRRLEEIGIDFALLYPSSALAALTIPDAELRGALCHAFNRYNAEVFADYRDRLEPVATIPTWTPEEALAELEHAVVELGLKTVVMSAVIPREVRTGGEPQRWIDTLAIDSLYDYDPVWQRCAELGVVPSFHALGYGWGTRNSTKNFMYNHIGHFGAAQEAACRALMFGGVGARFPALRFSFLEGGAAWACQLLCDALGHYAKRNRHVISALDPANIDVDGAGHLFTQFARGRMAAMRDAFMAGERRMRDAPPEDSIDDFADAGFESPEDIVELFAKHFFFGCEADDPMNRFAFATSFLPRGARINAMFASDIGHWDVLDMREVLPEAWEPVEDGSLSEGDFCSFTCTNIVRMLTEASPRFFDGTAVASDVLRHVAEGVAAAARGV